MIGRLKGDQSHVCGQRSLKILLRIFVRNTGRARSAVRFVFWMTSSSVFGPHSGLGVLAPRHDARPVGTNRFVVGGARRQPQKFARLGMLSTGRSA